MGKNVRIAYLIPLLCLTACSKSSIPEFIIEDYKGAPMEDIYFQIKNAYYHQMFFDKGIYNDRNFHYCVAKADDRYITINSFLLKHCYFESNGGYFVDFYINAYGSPLFPAGFIPTHRYPDLQLELCTRSFCPPVFYKDGIVFNVDEAINLGYLSKESFNVFLFDEQVYPIDGVEYNSYNLYTLKPPIEQIEIYSPEYVENLPPLLKEMK